MPAGWIISVPDRADIGDTWTAWIGVETDDGTAYAADSVTAAVTLPGGGTDSATVTAQTLTGLYKITYDMAVAGRHQVAVTVADATYGDEVLTAAVEVAEVTGTVPTIDAVLAWLGDESSWTAAEIASAYAAELASQVAACRIPTAYPADLAEALCRRVARSLAMRNLPLAIMSDDLGAGPIRPARTDPEIRRLEAPYRKLPAA